MVLELWPVWRSGRIHSIQTNYANRPGRPGEPFRRSRNGLARISAGRGRVNLWTRTSADVQVNHARAQAELMQGYQCQSVRVQFLPGFCQRQKKADFWGMPNPAMKLDFTRKQTAKNGGFVCRVILNLHVVLLKLWTVQRVKHVAFVGDY